MTGTFINVATVLAGTLIGTLVGVRLTAGLQDRVLGGLALVTLVLGVDNALAWRASTTVALCVLVGVLLGGIAGELIGIERRLEGLGDRLQARTSERIGGNVSQAFVTASLLFCVGPLTVLGSIDDGLRGDTQTLATKSVLDGFAAIALTASLGPGVAFSAITVLLVQGAITLGAGGLEPVLGEGSDALAALTSAGGMLIIGIALKLADLKDLKVGNYLPALVLAPAFVGLASLL